MSALNLQKADWLRSKFFVDAGRTPRYRNPWILIVRNITYLAPPTEVTPAPMRVPALETADRFMACLFALLVLEAVFPPTATGQAMNPRFGVGFSVVASTTDDVGLGLRARAALPLNANLSLGGDLGVTGFLFNGRDEAEYAIDPQFSFIVTLPGYDQAPYVMAGVGAYVSTSGSEGGPLFHFGVGRAQLIGEASIFYEIDPAIVIESNEVEFIFPIRFGLIF